MAHYSRALTLVVLIAGLASACGPGARSADPAREQTLTVQPRAFEVTLGFSGRVVPGERAELTAPFEGVVTEIAVAFGQRVEAGDRLIALNPADLERERIEAQTAYLRAEAEAARLIDWENGPEMSRARRDVSSGELALSDIERDLEETRALLDRGLVPRTEYDALQQRQRDQRIQLDEAREQLQTTRERGEGVYRRVAILERDLARERLDRIEADLESAVLTAPAAGVVVRPPEGDGERSAPVRAGGRVSRGDPLLVIARPDGLDVAFQLDEADVNTLETGAPVRVRGPGFPGAQLTGVLSSIAGQAEPGAGTDDAAFSGTVRLDPLPEAVAPQVRIGMTADIDVIVYASENALVVPAAAVGGVPGQAWVRVREGGDVRQVPVVIAIAAPDGVVIASGLAPGDTIVWSGR